MLRGFVPVAKTVLPDPPKVTGTVAPPDAVGVVPTPPFPENTEDVPENDASPSCAKELAAEPETVTDWPVPPIMLPEPPVAIKVNGPPLAAITSPA
jgi:hypothetical protein